VDDNITTVKILDSNITTAKIADDAITTTKIADANITRAKLLLTSGIVSDYEILASKNTGMGFYYLNSIWLA
tara:strand:+ start:241 stop:456 length:216 start_codon:yes stop_codon:yes gene_type:complete